MTALTTGAVAQPRFRSALLLTFAGLAVLLAFVGIYGVVGFNVAQRTHEISLRLALGAQRASLLSLILRQEARPVIVGMGIGLAGSFVVGRAMRGLLFDVASTDLTTFIGALVMLAAVVFVACIVPARRALRVEPATVLRGD